MDLIRYIQSHYKNIIWLAFAPFTMLFELVKMNGQDVFEILRPLRLILLVVIAGFFAFVYVSQGQHTMMTLQAYPSNLVSTAAIFVSLIYWSFQLFHASRMLLKLSNIRYDEGREIRLYVYMNNMPIIFGTLPFYILLAGYIRANGLYSLNDWFLVILVLLLNFILTAQHAKQTCKENDCDHHKNFRSLKFRKKVRQTLSDKNLTANMRRWFYFLIISFLILFSFFTYLSIYDIEVLQFIGPTAIIIFGLSAWVSVAAVVAVLNIHAYRYAGTVMMGLFIFSSFFNNNHAIETLNEPIGERLDVATQFRNWKQVRLKANPNRKKYPVFIVAAEGGGSRSAYWSGSLLGALSDTLPEFGNHIFAISAVSGGSLGAGFFSVMRREETMNKKSFSKLPFMQQALKKDFLSPLSASLAFPDFFQRLIPFKISAFDRAKALERSWEAATDTAMKSMDAENSLKINLNKIWSHDSMYQIPSLFLNCTVVNTGKRAVLSNLKLNAFDFDDVVALNDTIGKAICLSTAISLSARFPYITPSGVIENKDGSYWNSVADGGYFDNSGILTALEIIEIIKKENLTAKDKIIFEPHLIIISNYSDYVDKSYYNELNEPLKAALNRTFGGSIGYARARVKKELTPKNIIELPLKATVNEVPLGWYLSDSAINIMNHRVDFILKNNLPYFKEIIQ